MKLKGFKTILFSLVLVIIGALEAFGWVNVIPESLAPFVLPFIGLLFAWLRKVTNTAIGKSE